MLLFGREARTAARDATAAEARRARIGVAVSISGPIAAYAVGIVAAIITGAWAVCGLVTVLAIAAIAAIGLYLAPS